MILLASITTSLIYSLAFLSIYTHEQTRFAASKWIFNNIDQGSVIITENDDHFSLPIYLQNQPAKSYEFIRFNHPYKNDDAEKIDSYIQGLSKADFLIIANRRLYHTIGRLPEEYPFTSYYYKQLFKGALGYQKIAEFDSYPQIFGFKIKDYLAEETSGVFDHPKVMIFKNVDKKNKTDLNLILTSNLP